MFYKNVYTLSGHTKTGGLSWKKTQQTKKWVAVRTARYIGPARLNGIEAKKKKIMSAANSVITI